MSYATIVDMTFRKVDTLMPDQIEIGDYINLNGVIVHVIDIMPEDDGFTVVHEDEFGETEWSTIPDDVKVSLYVVDDD